jgi:hypothetical protein
MFVFARQKRRSQRVTQPCRSQRGSLSAGLLFFGAALVFMSSGCVTSVPVEDYTLARAAYESARDAEALRYAPALWYNAEQAYREGQRAYKERRYSDAEQNFKDARIAAEKAENTARIARHNAGDL